MALTAEQIAIVKSTVPVVKEHGKTITTVFYQRLLAAHPELKNYFSLRHQQVGAQQAALADAVFAYAAHIDDLGKLAGAVERIANKHASLFVRPEHYPIVGEFLVAAFAEVLGDALTDDVADAWIAAYGQLADVFIQRERRLYDEAADWKDWRPFVVDRREPVATDVVSFYLRPKDGKPLRRYLPGQYISVRIAIPELDGLYQNRQFSLSTAPAEDMDVYRVSVKREETVDEPAVEDLAEGKVPGLISNKLHNDYPEGAEVLVSPPYGDFFFDHAAARPAAPAVLLSIGVGATPLLSILESIVGSANPSRPVTWAHAARSSDRVCFGSNVRDIAARHASVKPLLFVKNVQKGDERGREYDVEGRISLDKVESEGLLHLSDRTAGYYICGPDEWMVQSRKWLMDKGVPVERIHLELFGTGEP
ncbi:hypothetical protein HIM_09370 [Hirsutella minnesotensis 3608]|uniref:nitric oxide dioxygenase n=1 Tax=Hirsutella minnesotensis 3608 TaxID=1043627 RepID=A0A0F7ZXS4_9HYPO|nr:hypothetical protein HIM_09370 [Hirsutella minnesotensis 3608]